MSGRKRFFFEKKNQKTFPPMPDGNTRCHGRKVFLLLFLQKKKALLAHYVSSDARRRSLAHAARVQKGTHRVARIAAVRQVRPTHGRAWHGAHRDTG
jgi:hypothetical protein